eukprot:2370486-Amphidinium_carterae.1
MATLKALCTIASCQTPPSIKLTTRAFLHFGGGLFHLLVSLRTEPSFRSLKVRQVSRNLSAQHPGRVPLHPVVRLTQGRTLPTASHSGTGPLCLCLG